MPKNFMQENSIRQAVRDILARDPLASSRVVAMTVTQQLGIVVGHDYVQKMMRKTTIQVRKDVELKTAAIQLAKMAERFRMMIESLEESFYERDKDGAFTMSNKDRVATTKAIESMERTLYVSMMDAGLFTRHRGVLDIKHGLSQPDDTPPHDIEQLSKALQNWGMVETENTPVPVDAAIMDDQTMVILNNNEDPNEQSGDVSSGTKDSAAPVGPKIFRAGPVDIDEELGKQEAAKKPN